jgi:exodeoxyribonuclease X
VTEDGAVRPDVLSAPWAQAGWVVVDVEGNGHSPADLVEAACVLVDAGKPDQARVWLVKPPRPIQHRVTRVHGITNADVADAPPAAAVAAQIRAALVGRIVVGHAVHVDVDVLIRALPGWAPPATVDTLRLAKRVWPGRASYRLDVLAEAAGVAPIADGGGRHRAGYDACLTSGVFLALARAAGDGLPLSTRDLIALAAPRGHGEARLF